MKFLKRSMSVILAIIMTASPLLCMAQAADTGESVYRHTSNPAEDFTYINETMMNSSGQQETFCVEITPDSDVYPVVFGCDTIYGGMTAETAVRYMRDAGYNVVGIMNSDFFSTSTHVPMGIVIEDGVYKSSPSGRNAVGIDESGAMFFAENLTVDIKLTNLTLPERRENKESAGEEVTGKETASEPERDEKLIAEEGGEDGESIVNASADVSLTGEIGARAAEKMDNLTVVQNFNKMRVASGGMYLYSDAFSTVSTRTTSEGWFVVMKILEGDCSLSGTMTLQVTELVRDVSVPLSEGYMVLTADSRAGLNSEFEKFAAGDIIKLEFACSDERMCGAQWASGGGDMLISEGAVTDPANWDSAIAAKNPRSAVGVKEDGTMVFFVADGRRSAYASGLTLRQLAEEMLLRGCVYAMNLDGGGSSVMGVRNTGETGTPLVNSPSDGAARRCSTYIVLVTDNVSDGTVRNLGILEDGAIVAAGASIELSFTASDSAYMPAEPAEDIIVESSGLGSVSENIYTAGDTAGEDVLTLSLPAGEWMDTASLYVITEATGMSVRNASGSTVKSIDVRYGDSVTLVPSLKYYGKDVVSDMTTFSYNVTGGVGTVDENGCFTASGMPGTTGSVIVSGCGLTVEIPVTVEEELLDIRGHWAEPFVRELYDAGYVKGTTSVTYSPDLNMKRGDFVLMIFRAAGKGSVEWTGAFTDVDPDDYYADAINWAYTNGLVNGTAEGIFSPEEVLTREQAFALIYRLLAFAGADGLPQGTSELLQSFEDFEDMAEYAVAPTAALYEMKLIDGMDGLLKPKDNLTRAQMAKLLCLAIKYM